MRPDAGISKGPAMQKNYNKTMTACFVGYIVQAIVNNFVPLLFLTFQRTYDIPLSQITLLVTINFGVQLLVDLISVTFVDRIGYRLSLILAHVCASAGLLLLTVLPDMMANPFAGILCAVIIYAIGGGLLEVLVSPVMESCPSDNKEKAMSMLHSFYCWGHVGVVLLSTVFFRLFGIANWRYVAIIWAIVPLYNIYALATAPFAPLLKEGETGHSLAELFRMKIFWILLVMMICAGASEQAVSQWASTFAESALGVSKTIGDLTGPMFFAICMGTARAIYGKYGEKIRLEKFMSLSCLLCIFSYLLISLAPWPAIGLLGCGICGFSVGIFWPGTFSMSSAAMRRGGSALFCLLALAGDLGCSLGPTVVGMVTGAAGDNMKLGVLAAIIFPVGLLLCVFAKKRSKVQVVE